MRVFKCLFTGDEMFTDTYPMENEDGLFRIKGKYVTRSEKFDDSKLGANPSAEEESEGAEDATISGINVIMDNRLQKTNFGSKKEFINYFKEYAKRLEELKKCQNPQFDAVTWRAQVQTTFKKALANFDSYEFFTGESCNPDGCIAMVRWESGPDVPDDVPYIYFFVEGIKEEKC